MFNKKSIVSVNETVTSNKKDKTVKKNNGYFPNDFNVEEFRNDIINQLDVNVLKQKYEKYGFESRMKIESFIQRLTQMDKVFYDYEFPEVIRGEDVYEAGDGFIKVSKRVAERFKAELGVDKLGFQNVELVGNTIVLTLQAA